MITSQFPELFALGFEDKLRIVEALWDSIAQRPESIPVPEWQKQELDRRKTAAQSNLQDGITWEQAKAQIRGRHGA
jgi:putative addiction module component (TIGR02574 family)